VGTWDTPDTESLLDKIILVCCLCVFVRKHFTNEMSPVYERGFSFFSLKRAMRATPETCSNIITVRLESHTTPLTNT